MADYTTTNTTIVSSTSRTKQVTFGGTVAIRDFVYQAADTKYYAVDVTDTELKATAVAMALTGGIANELGLILFDDVELDLGFTPTFNEPITCSQANAGKISPHADLITSTNWVTIIGWPTSGDNFYFKIFPKRWQIV